MYSGNFPVIVTQAPLANRRLWTNTEDMKRLLAKLAVALIGLWSLAVPPLVTAGHSAPPGVVPGSGSARATRCGRMENIFPESGCSEAWYRACLGCNTPESPFNPPNPRQTGL